ncbi:MAG: 50S ribosomal protein L24 [Chloroflexi bacterium]|nr:50S ribosomal protein L24 [Chloroflexota bacterium]
MKIRKNDEVQVIAGKKDKEGKFPRGKVHRVLVAEDRVVVSGVHMIKRHTKPGRVRTQAGIIEREAPIHVSNVMLVCPKCSRATRVGFRFLADGAKVRVCKRCGEMMDKQ